MSDVTEDGAPQTDGQPGHLDSMKAIEGEQPDLVARQDLQLLIEIYQGPGGIAIKSRIDPKQAVGVLHAAMWEMQQQAILDGVRGNLEKVLTDREASRTNQAGRIVMPSGVSFGGPGK